MDSQGYTRYGMCGHYMLWRPVYFNCPEDFRQEHIMTQTMNREYARLRHTCEQVAEAFGLPLYRPGNRWGDGTLGPVSITLVPDGEEYEARPVPPITVEVWPAGGEAAAAIAAQVVKSLAQELPEQRVELIVSKRPE